MSKIHNLPNAAPRLVSTDATQFGVRNYGEDNGYPQRMLNLYNASRSAKMCAELCARYIIGKGFEDKVFYKSKINDNGLTPDKLIRMLANDRAKLKGVALHINYNALYQVESVHYVPFENCRLGIDENSNKIGVSDKWFSADRRNKLKDVDIEFIDKWNPDPLYIEKQVERAGGWENYKGQLLWLSSEFECYPLATIDPVLDDAQAEIESGITRRNNLRNNFQLKHIWVEKGQTVDEEEEQQVVNGVREFVGPEGNHVSVVFSKDPDGKDVPTLVPITSMINDKLFEYTDSAARLAIYTAFGQPAILHSDYNATNGYNEGQLPQSMTAYSSYTEPDRILFEEIFTEVFSRFKDNINPSGSYTLIPLDTSKTLVELIGVQGASALQGIVSDTTTTPEQKKSLLTIVYGLSEEQANQLSGI